MSLNNLFLVDCQMTITEWVYLFCITIKIENENQYPDRIFYFNFNFHVMLFMCFKKILYVF